MKEKFYDVIIIGGGPSGATCGIFLKKLDPSLRVCIIDKESFPRKKPCGDGLSPGVVDIINEAGFGEFFFERFPISNFELSCGNSIDIKYDLRNLFESNSYGFVYQRELFDEKLIDCAVKAGVDFFQKHNIAEIREIEPWRTQVSCRYDRDNFQFIGKIIVGADGANSKIRSYLKIPSNDDRHMGIGLKYYCSYKGSDEMSLRIDILKSLKSSYGWFFPFSKDLANIGIGVNVDVYKKYKINLNKEFDNYLLFLKDKMQLELIPGSRGGYPLPYGSQMPKLVHGNKVLIGDAASMINPLTGEGIYYGMYAGKALAANIAGSFGSGDELGTALQKFSVDFQNRFQNHYKLNLRIKNLLSSPFSGILLKALAKDKVLLGKVMGIMLGNSNSFNVENFSLKVIKKSTKYIYEQFKSHI
ncbi:MAG: geranylgeranyl reductase family protein [Ferruginibacter sp.]